mgnify:CR=1 FL=1
MTNTVKKINMIEAVKLFFKNYFNFTGRASRSEYWWFILAYFILLFVLSFVEGFIVGLMAYNDPYGALNILRFWYLMPSNILNIAMFIGILSLVARRLQDRGHSGWWQLANILPGILFLIPYLAILDSMIYGGSINPGAAIAATIFGIISFGTAVTLIVFLCLPPKEDENKWGRNPLLPETSSTDQIPD